MGKKTGVETFYYESGQEKSTQVYKFGKKQGEYTEFHPNGKVAVKGLYSGNMKVEDWKYYNEKGELLKTEKYFRDKLQETIDN